jgi:hypothetical protein
VIDIFGRLHIYDVKVRNNYLTHFLNLHLKNLALQLTFRRRPSSLTQKRSDLPMTAPIKTHKSQPQRDKPIILTTALVMSSRQIASVGVENNSGELSTRSLSLQQVCFIASAILL